MKVTENMQEFSAACMDTAFNAICVKSRDRNAKYQFGKIVSPDDIRWFAGRFLIEGSPEIKVRGHGWDGETMFVWTGTPDEFNETWEID